MTDIYKGPDALKNGTQKGPGHSSEPYSKNFVYDTVTIIKPFYIWMIDAGYSTLKEKDILLLETTQTGFDDQDSRGYSDGRGEQKKTVYHFQHSFSYNVLYLLRISLLPFGLRDRKDLFPYIIGIMPFNLIFGRDQVKRFFFAYQIVSKFTSFKKYHIIPRDLFLPIVNRFYSARN